MFNERYVEFEKAQKAKILASYGLAPNGEPLEKGGEGSRGGKVIGHTKSGKPLYGPKSWRGHMPFLSDYREKHKDFSVEDHREAAEIHDKVGDYANSHAASAHRRLADEKDPAIKNKISLRSWGDLQKGGEGSRGGQVIGHTRSGKPIYLHENGSAATSAGGIHSKHFTGWSKEDHLDAIKTHREAKDAIHKKWHKEHADHIERHGGSAGFKPSNHEQEERDRMNHMHNMDAHHYHHVRLGGSRTDSYDAANLPYDKSKKDEINARPFKK